MQSMQDVCNKDKTEMDGRKCFGALIVAVLIDGMWS